MFPRKKARDCSLGNTSKLGQRCRRKTIMINAVSNGECMSYGAIPHFTQGG